MSDVPVLLIKAILPLLVLGAVIYYAGGGPPRASASRPLMTRARAPR